MLCPLPSCASQPWERQIFFEDFNYIILYRSHVRIGLPVVCSRSFNSIRVPATISPNSFHHFGKSVSLKPTSSDPFIWQRQQIVASHKRSPALHVHVVFGLESGITSGGSLHVIT